MDAKKIFIHVAVLAFVQTTLADPLANCIIALDQVETLRPISDKVSLTGKPDRLFSMLANENLPTMEERGAIFEWATRRERCFSENPLPSDPISQVKRETQEAVQLLILDLYKGKLTYGQFASRRQEIGKAASLRMQQISQQERQAQEQRQIQQQQQLQQLQSQRQQERMRRLEQCDANYQLCMNRAGDSARFRNQCEMERSGCELGNAIFDSLR